MKSFIAVFLAGVVTLSLTACGSHAKLTPAEQQQEHAAVAKFDKVARACLPVKDGAPNVLVLRTHAARQQFMNCAVPPAQRVQFNSCVTHVALAGLPTKKRIESGVSACLAKVES